MRVSIVTISFNQVKFLEHTLTSVLLQDYYDVEYIVVDPGSTDGSRDILADYAQRIDHLLLTPDDGPADGLNRGCSVATGEVLGYVNASDALLPGAVSAAVRHLKDDAALDVVYGHAYLIDDTGDVIRRLRSSPFGLRRYAYGYCPIVQPSTFLRRKAFAAVPGFNVANRTSWDGELIVDLAMRESRFRRADEYWSLFRRHADSISGPGLADAAYRCDRLRLFKRVIGRPRRRRDNWFAAYFWIYKWLRDPVGLFYRLYDEHRGRKRCLCELHGKHHANTIDSE